VSAEPIDTGDIKRPPLIFAAMEMLRASFEGASLMMSAPLLAAAPRGDGHSVIVLAGYQGEHVAREIDRVYKRTSRKLSLVGWSLGGVIAREAARRDPRAVRQVITIGSPFSGNPHANHVGEAYKMLSGHDVDSPAARRRFAIGPKPLPMPSTAIYSRSDGITAWENCLAHEDHQSENVEVRSSHLGLPINPRVFQVVADRLSQPEGIWAPYQRGGP
jgi:pimeloyl-ACP methyl ester carboxylesterase